MRKGTTSENTSSGVMPGQDVGPVVHAWADLPDAMKRGILAMVQAVE